MHIRPESDTTIQKKGDSLLPALCAAGLFWVIYTLYLDDFLATDLRLISSVLAQKILSLLSIEVQRNGTVLFRDGIKFEVIAACSGSTILKTILGSAIFISLSWRGLTILQRLGAIIFSLVIAIACNGIRVAVLVLLGLRTGTPVAEGTLHDIIGIATFLCSFFIFCLICLSLSTRNKNKTTRHPLWHTILQALLTTLCLYLLYLPFILDSVHSWLGSSWDNSNRGAYIFWIIPLLLASLQAHRHHNSGMVPGKHTRLLLLILLSSALGLGVLSRFLSVQILSGFGIILLSITAILRYSGILNTLLSLPLLLLPVLSFPRILLRLQDLFPAALTLTPENIRYLIFILTIILQQLLSFLLYRKLPVSVQKSSANKKHTHTNPIFYGSILALTLVLLIPDNISNPKTSSPNRRIELNLPYYLAGWIGRDLPVSASDASYFGRNNIIYREYRNTAKTLIAPVRLLLTFSRGDRHKNHPPEFCQNGIGWSVTSRQTIILDAASPRRVNLLQLERKQQKKYLVYYFTAGSYRGDKLLTNLCLKTYALAGF